MSRESWSKHDRAFWLERSEDPVQPLGVRVTALAYAHHSENGHAHFEPGEVCKRLTRVDVLSSLTVCSSQRVVVPAHSRLSDPVRQRALADGGSGSRAPSRA